MTRDDKIKAICLTLLDDHYHGLGMRIVVKASGGCICEACEAARELLEGMVEKPTKWQINKFIEYLHNLEMFNWNHSGNVPPDPDLVAVVRWLQAEGGSK